MCGFCPAECVGSVQHSIVWVSVHRVAALAFSLTPHLTLRTYKSRHPIACHVTQYPSGPLHTHTCKGEHIFCILMSGWGSMICMANEFCHILVSGPCSSSCMANDFCRISMSGSYPTSAWQMTSAVLHWSTAPFQCKDFSSHSLTHIGVVTNINKHCNQNKHWRWFVQYLRRSLETRTCLQNSDLAYRLDCFDVYGESVSLWKISSLQQTFEQTFSTDFFTVKSVLCALYVKLLFFKTLWPLADIVSLYLVWWPSSGSLWPF